MEVAVKADPIREEGDTITYNVGSFAQAQNLCRNKRQNCSDNGLFAKIVPFSEYFTIFAKKLHHLSELITEWDLPRMVILLLTTVTFLK